MEFKLWEIRNQGIDNLGPRLVQRLVPDACGEGCDVHSHALIPEDEGPFLVEAFPELGLD